MGDKTEITRESKGEVPLSQILSRARREKINSPGKMQILDPLRFAIDNPCIIRYNYYISWEMTTTSIGGEKQAGISGGSQSPS